MITKLYSPPPLCKREMLRYAACRGEDPAVTALLDECVREAETVLGYAVCYRELPLTVAGDTCDVGGISICSKTLADNLRGCDRVVVFGATVGMGLDRLIAKYGRLSPAKAVLFQAVGAERIEALCDAFCDDLSRMYAEGVRRRISPGYGDLPLEVQRRLFDLLDCAKHIGLSLTDSLLMCPSKSVTAFVGIGGEGQPTRHRCDVCGMTNCMFRGAV